MTYDNIKSHKKQGFALFMKNTFFGNTLEEGRGGSEVGSGRGGAALLTVLRLK